MMALLSKVSNLLMAGVVMPGVALLRTRVMPNKHYPLQKVLAEMSW